MKPLTALQKRFASEFIKDEHGRQACVRAGYSPKAASQQATKLLANERIRDLIAKLQSEQPPADDMSRSGHVKALADIRDKALANGKYQAAAQAEKARGLALGFQGPRKPGPGGGASAQDDQETLSKIFESVRRELAERKRREGIADGKLPAVGEHETMSQIMHGTALDSSPSGLQTNGSGDE